MFLKKEAKKRNFKRKEEKEAEWDASIITKKEGEGEGEGVRVCDDFGLISDFCLNSHRSLLNSHFLRSWTALKKNSSFLFWYLSYKQYRINEMKALIVKNNDRSRYV